MSIKIAIPTDDGVTISRHFGQAKSFSVITIENDQVTNTELRQKASHQHGDHSHSGGVHPGQQMVATILDCKILISGGMGTPAFEKATSAGLKVIMTGLLSIDDALKSYITGKLKDDPDLIHSH